MKRGALWAVLAVLVAVPSFATDDQSLCKKLTAAELNDGRDERQVHATLLLREAPVWAKDVRRGCYKIENLQPDTEVNVDAKGTLLSYYDPGQRQVVSIIDVDKAETRYQQVQNSAEEFMAPLTQVEAVRSSETGAPVVSFLLLMILLKIVFYTAMALAITYVVTRGFRWGIHGMKLPPLRVVLDCGHDPVAAVPSPLINAGQLELCLVRQPHKILFEDGGAMVETATGPEPCPHQCRHVALNADGTAWVLKLK